MTDEQNLIRLLQLTAESRSPVIQDFRQVVARCLNANEATISELEMQNFDLMRKNRRLKKLMVNILQQQGIIWELLNND